MRLSENRSEEIQALIKVIEFLRTRTPKKEMLTHLNWFYREVKDIVERQLEES